MTTAIASNPGTYLSQSLASLAQLLAPTQASDPSSSNSMNPTATTAISANNPPPMTPPPSLSGQFSPEVLASLLSTQMTDSPAASASSSSGATATASPTVSGPDVLSQLFAAQQQTPANLAAQAIASADTNGDGALSLTEIEGSLAQSQGVASASDLSASQTTAITSAFNSLDTNGDGSLSASELSAGIQTMQTADQAAGPGRPSGAHHGHHHGGGGGGGGASSTPDALEAALSGSTTSTSVSNGVTTTTTTDAATGESTTSVTSQASAA
jgi:hypothetical protein